MLNVTGAEGVASILSLENCGLAQTASALSR